MKANPQFKEQATIQPFSWKRRIKNYLANAVTNPYNLIVIISLAVLAYLIVIPLIEMIVTTFRLSEVDVRRIPGAETGDFSLYY